ncbi:MAG: VCBS repeat-containing protein [Methanobacteriota archaeon]
MDTSHDDLNHDGPADTPSGGPCDEPLSGNDPQVRWGALPTLDPTAPVNCTRTADVNLDGCVDILSTQDNSGIKIWLGNGTGQWAAATSPVSSGVYMDVAVGDINNDGAPDIVAGKNNGGIYAWCKNKTTGGWNSASAGLPATRPYKTVTLTDFNNDGNLDIVAGGSASGPNKGVSAYRGNGRGAWTISDTGLPMSGVYGAVTTADLNRDGNPDIAATSNAGVDTWTGDGKGNWTLRDSGLPSTGTYSDVEFCDFNLDGMLDIVATSDLNAGMRVWSGDGMGLWTMKLGLPTEGSYSGVQVADVNLDGYPDILASSTENNQTIWTGDGDDNWYLQTDGLPADCFCKGLSIADIDRDGRIDFCGPGVSGGIKIWSSEVLRSVSEWAPYSAPSTTATVNDIAAFDINMDGKLDICYATQANGIQIYSGNGAGSWAPFASPTSTGTCNAVRLCDFSRDGKPDIVAASSAGVQAWTGNGAGTWTSRASGLPGTGSWFALGVGDFNDDGILDISAGSGQGSGMRLYSGDGAGLWTLKLGLPLSATFYDIGVVDENRDGDLDLVMSSSTGLRCYLGNGAFNWTQASSDFPAATTFRNVEIADVNRDGYADVFATASGADGAKAWLGNGGVTWAYDSQLTASSSGGLFLGDVSLDGVVDAVVGADGSASGVACETRQDGNWSSLSSGLPGVGNYRALRLADINVDGLLDILASNGSSPGAAIWVGVYSAPSSQWFNITVVDGWNFVSVPLASSNESLPFSLTDKADGGGGLVQWDRAMWRNPSSPNDPWKQYNSAWPAEMNDLKSVQSHVGVWLHVTVVGDGKICLGGAGYSEFSGTAVPLKAGWNMVGYPSATGGQTIADLKSECPSVDSVEAFSAVAVYKTWAPPDSYALVRGEGYWVHCTADAVWYVP